MNVEHLFFFVGGAGAGLLARWIFLKLQRIS